MQSHPDDGVLCCERCHRCSSRSTTDDSASRDAVDPDTSATSSDARVPSNVSTASASTSVTFTVPPSNGDSSERPTATTEATTLRQRLDPLRWRILRGRFFMVNGANLSCACARSPNGFSRFSHVGDGRVDLVLVRHTWMVRNLRLLLKLASRRGRIVSVYWVNCCLIRLIKLRHYLCHHISDAVRAAVRRYTPRAQFPFPHRGHDGRGGSGRRPVRLRQQRC